VSPRPARGVTDTSIHRNPSPIQHRESTLRPEEAKAPLGRSYIVRAPNRLNRLPLGMFSQGFWGNRNQGGGLAGESVRLTKVPDTGCGRPDYEIGLSHQLAGGDDHLRDG